MSVSFGVRLMVTARSDGRGGIRPFGTYGKAQAGYSVQVGHQTLQVGRDGRVNIPKAVMERYGVLGDDGRRRIEVVFAWHRQGADVPDVGATVATPTYEMRNAKTGDTARGFAEETNLLEPEDSRDYNWSPLQ